MDYVNNIITSSDVNAFFGENNNQLGKTIESTLRFIALKHHQGDIETIKPIKSYTQWFGNGDNIVNYIRHAIDEDIELFVLAARNGAQLMTTNEEGWVSLDTPPYPVAPFLSKASETRVYINTSLKKALVVVRNATDRWVDILCSCLFRVLPWRFDKEMSDDEKSLFKAINTKDFESFNSIINRECEKYNFKEISLRKVLIGWCDGYREKQIDILKNKYSSVSNDIVNYEQHLADLLNQLSAVCVHINALESQSKDNNDSFYKFFINHKQLEIYNTSKTSNGNVMYYCVTETIEYFDQDEFARVYNNTQSSIGMVSQEIKEVLFGIFGANKGVLRVEAIFKLTNLSSCEAISKTRTGRYNQTHLPHPHLYHYACLGGNSTHINKYMMEGNWDMAIEQTIAAVKNINFGDATVMGKFVTDLRDALNSSCKCIIADNGKEMTLREFLAYLRENNKNEGAENG